MLPPEALLALLDQQRADTIALVEQPDGRDAFAFGEVVGRLRAIARIREGLDDLIHQYLDEEEDNV